MSEKGQTSQVDKTLKYAKEREDDAFLHDLLMEAGGQMPHSSDINDSDNLPYSCDINDSDNLPHSSDMNDSNNLPHSSDMNDSDNLPHSSDINDSDNLPHSSDMNDSDNLPHTTDVNDSDNLPHSSDINDSDNLPHSSDMNDSDNLPHSSDINDSDNLPHSSDMNDSDNLPHSSDINDSDNLPHSSDINDSDNLPHSSDINDSDNLPHSSDINDSNNLPHSSDIDDSANLPHSSDMNDSDNLPHSSDINDSDNLPHSSDINDNDNLPHSSDINYSNNLRHSSDINDSDNLPHSSDKNDSDNLPHSSDMNDSDNLPHSSDINDSNNLPHSSDMNGSDNLPHSSDINDSDNLPHSSDINDSDNLPHSSDINDSDNLPHSSDMNDSNNLPHSSDMNDSDNLPHSSDINDSDNLPHSSDMNDSDNLPHTTDVNDSDNLPHSSDINDSDNLPHSSDMNDSDNLPHSSDMNDSDNLPHSSDMNDSDNLPHSSDINDSDNLPHSSDINDSNNLPHSSDIDDSANLPHSSDKNDSDNLPHSSDMNDSDNLPHCDINDSNNLPHSSDMNGSDNLPHSSDINDSDNLPHSSDINDSDNLPHSSYMNDSNNLPHSSDMNDSDNLPHSSDMNDSNNLAHSSDTNDTKNLPHSSDINDIDNLPHSSDINNSDNLTYDWETSEILHIVKTFPISDYGTKSDDDQSLSGFTVPEPPSLSGIADSMTDKSSSSNSTDVEENYIEDDLSSLSAITDVEVSSPQRKHEFAKEKVEREGNICGKLYNAALKGELSIVKDILAMHNTILMPDEDGQTPLFAACIGNHSEIVNVLIDSGYDMNHQDNEGKTPLHIAFENHAPEFAQTLITQFTADTEVRDKYNWTPLHTAIDRGYFLYSQKFSETFLHQDVGTEVSWIHLHAACFLGNTQDVQVLLEAKADVNRASSAGHTPLHIAVTKNNIGLVSYLLDQNADVDSMNTDGQTPFHIAVDRGEENIIQQLLEKKANPNLTDRLGNTSLHLAVQLKQEKPKIFKLLSPKYYSKAGAHIAVGDRWHSPASYRTCSAQTVQAIIKHTDNINAVNNKCQTALWFACSDGRDDLVKVLLNVGADPKISDTNGDSSLHAAIYGWCSTETVQNIICHGAQVNTVNNTGETPLLIACTMAHEQLVTFLLKSKADPNITNSEGHACLHSAVDVDCSRETLLELVDCGADVNAKDKRGRTGLLLSCFYGQMDSVKALLGAGADPTVDDEEGFSCIHAAIDGRCSTDVLQKLIDHGAHVNAKRQDGTTALIRACSTGQSESVMFLLKEGADVNIIKLNGNTILHAAVCGNCSKDAVQNITEHGLNVNATNKHGETALSLACQVARAEFIKLLLENGANPNVADANGNTSLHAAVHVNCTDEILQDIITHKASLDAQNIDGETALLLACSRRLQGTAKILLEAGSNCIIAANDHDTSLHAAVLGNCSKHLINNLIDHGADVNATNKRNHTALMLASGKGKVDVMKVLIKAGANKTIEDTDGKTWLHYAVLGNCNKEVLQAVIDLGADVNATNKRNQTALMGASWNGNIDAINVLINAGANKTTEDTDGDTWLHYAVKGNCSKEVLQAVIDLGADVNATNKLNITALMWASLNGNIDAMNVLINAGANKTIGNAAGYTWLHYAVDGKCSKEVLQAVIDLGADVNATNKLNQTALMWASKIGNVDAMNVLINAGANKTIESADGDTWLHYAVDLNCSKEVLLAVIDLGADVNATNKRNETPLMWASNKGNVDAMNVLINAGANKTIESADGDTWLHYAVDLNCSKEVLLAVIDLGADVNATNKRNETPLMWASNKGNVDAMNVLINAGANKTIECADGNTWLHYAVNGNCSKEVLLAVIDLGADVNATNKRNETALMWASNKGNVDAMNVLINAGANKTIETAYGDTWLHCAVHGNCSKEVLQAVIDLGADVNATNKHNETALMLASRRGNVDAMNVLINAGANKTIESADGYTWLHYAVYGNCSKEVLQAVIDLGADVNATNKHNETALMWASKNGNIDAMNVLINAGANKTIETAYGDTWLHYAVHGNCSKEVLQAVIGLGVDVNATNKHNETALMWASKNGNIDAMNALISAGANKTIE